MYYRNKIEALQKIFGTTDIELKGSVLRVSAKQFPIIDDVIDLTGEIASPQAPFSEDIQYTFGAEWQAHNQILPEHHKEFTQYFDLVDLSTLRNLSVCDLGCGSGRWSAFIKDYCRELILVDFSNAIFVARKNLRGSDHCLFFKGDVLQLPFAPDFTDFIFSLGVLHHLPAPCLQVTRGLKRYAPRMLIFLYYALDNRPFYFRLILGFVTVVRRGLARIRSPLFRKSFSVAGTIGLYLPLVALGRLFDIVGLGRYIPLYEFYHNKGFNRIEQDVYDRFFTRIEQRVSRKEILELKSDFSEVLISERLPYWHFLLVR